MAKEFSYAAVHLLHYYITTTTTTIITIVKSPQRVHSPIHSSLLCDDSFIHACYRQPHLIFGSISHSFIVTSTSSDSHFSHTCLGIVIRENTPIQRISYRGKTLPRITSSSVQTSGNDESVIHFQISHLSFTLLILSPDC